MKIQKINLEYLFTCTISSLFRAVSTGAGFKDWFADDVNVNGNHFTFYWHKVPQTAVMLHSKENRITRFKWEDDEVESTYFEFKIRVQELTGDIALIITDFAPENEVEDHIHIWNTQIKNLKRILGSN